MFYPIGKWNKTVLDIGGVEVAPAVEMIWSQTSTANDLAVSEA